MVHLKRGRTSASNITGESNPAPTYKKQRTNVQSIAFKRRLVRLTLKNSNATKDKQTNKRKDLRTTGQTKSAKVNGRPKEVTSQTDTSREMGSLKTKRNKNRVQRLDMDNKAITNKRSDNTPSAPLAHEETTTTG